MPNNKAPPAVPEYFKKSLRLIPVANLILLPFRTHLKNVFWPNIFVGASLQILDPPQADLRFSTHKSYLIRREVPHRGKTRPHRDLEPKSYF